MPLTIAAATPADTDLFPALRALDAAVGRADRWDMPLLDAQPYLAFHRNPPPDHDVAYGLAYAGAELAGYTSLLFPLRENTHTVEVHVLDVHPEHRRRGAGRALADFAVAQARRRGRTTLLGPTARQLPGGPPRPAAGPAFAAGLGAANALDEVRRRLDVRAVDPAALAALVDAARPHAAGYSLVRWGAAAPAEYVEDVAYLDSRLLGDAPLGDLALEPQRVDAARVRATEELAAARLARPYNVGARHDATGRLVAWTQVRCTDNDLGHAWQQITLVDPAHRGHRLGLLIKAENLRYALAGEPGLRVIDTFNAAVNGPMIAINEQLGYRPLDGWDNWQWVLPPAATVDG
ncbi:GNAT family N-acetyltransferase [Pilimelia anulata]|uniref:GNAT family N-acetyltransferase n=1 Tax=Pilimelia anulata TaxID=53371 RepID=A0A8J3F922_9ACTN|nr:GNAT family N-acetyltransferase [Pilimelia anulata]GGJ90946.1 GNAT family N-acetyltransferase [Pilimelia anulata]